MKLAVFGEALTYPPKEGITAHVFSFLESLKDTNISPVLLLADRGFIKKSVIANFNWPTMLINPSIFYDYEEMKKILDEIAPDALQSYNVYQARLIAARYSFERKLPLIFEHHDIEEHLAEFLGLSKDITNKNTNSQLELAAMASLNRVMSYSDHKYLVKRIPQGVNTIKHIPVGIADEFKDLDVSKRDIRSLVFIGNGAYAPNHQAIRHIIENIAPEMPEYSFHIAGRMTDKLALGAPKNVTGYGMVEDLGEIYSKASFGLVPLAAGSGMKIKILSYLSAGLPVFGTKISFEGIAANEALIECSTTEFPIKIRKEIINKNYAHLSGQARKLYVQNFNSAKIVADIERLYSKLTFSPSAERSAFQPIERDDSRLAWIHESRENVHPITKGVKYFKGRQK